MSTDPYERLARTPAPPYAGEADFALWHVSEDPGLHRFEPHVPATNPDAHPAIWAVDTRHLPTFWFPRDCPRGCIWPGASTTDDDRQRFFGQSATERIHVIESAWFDEMRACHLFAYRLPTDGFEPNQVGGYWVRHEPVDAVERIELDDLVGRHARAGIELRVTPSIWPFWKQVAASTLEFSGSRLSNAADHPDRF